MFFHLTHSITSTLYLTRPLSLSLSRKYTHNTHTTQHTPYTDNLSFLNEQTTKPCSLVCFNGGKPNVQCSKCESCEQGWSGYKCSDPITCLSDNQQELPTCFHGAMWNQDTCECDCLVGFHGEFCQCTSVCGCVYVCGCVWVFVIDNETYV